MSGALDERLSLLLEEMGEAIQIIGKIQRHGWQSYDPTKNDSPSNQRLLEKELGDVTHAMQMMVRAGDVRQDIIDDRLKRRPELVLQYLHHQKPEIVGVKP